MQGSVLVCHPVAIRSELGTVVHWLISALGIVEVVQHIVAQTRDHAWQTCRAASDEDGRGQLGTKVDRKLAR
jgi:hypothetical protein